MFHSRNHKDDNGAFTILELVIATGVVGILAYVMMTFVKNTEQSTQKELLRVELRGEMDELLNLVRNTWKARSYSADNPGFSLRSASGAECTTNCPELRIDINKGINSVAQNVVIKSRCAPPLGTISQPAKFAQYSFNAAALVNGCLVCGGGTMPIVEVSRTGKPTRRFPLNGSIAASAGKPTTFLVNGIIGFNACFSQSGTGPLTGYVLSLAPPTNKSSTVPMNVNKTVIIPYTNFANIKINAN
ncbi:MAG: hypothetical protein FJ146_08035 [Deltaproteobacteria bacterium]|nr:hypothetical protein [Deltaproteobacteria bacterium]